MESIKLEKFSFSEISKSSNILVFGQIDENLINYVKNMSFGLIFSSNDIYLKHFDKSCIYPKYNKTMVNRLINKQCKSKDILNNIIFGNKNKRMKKDTNTFIIFDNQPFTNDNIMREVIFNGRIYNITVIIIFDKFTPLTPAVRENIDYLFLSKTDDKDNIYKYYLRCMLSSEVFNIVYDELKSKFIIFPRDTKKIYTLN